MHKVIIAASLSLLPLTAQAQTRSVEIEIRPGPAQPAPQGVDTGQWFTTPDGCTYSRVGPPGAEPRWIIVKNPRHIGRPNAHRGCKAML